MEGFKQPKVGNFVPDSQSMYPWGGRGHIETWRCVICNTPGIRDRILHNLKGCAPVGWLDPLGVLVETVFALWGPEAPDVVQIQYAPIPEQKSIRVSELPYFTQMPYEGWMVIGYKEFLRPGDLVVVNRKTASPAEVYIDEVKYARVSPRSGRTFVMATFHRAGEE